MMQFVGCILFFERLYFVVQGWLEDRTSSMIKSMSSRDEIGSKNYIETPSDPYLNTYLPYDRNNVDSSNVANILLKSDGFKMI